MIASKLACASLRGLTVSSGRNLLKISISKPNQILTRPYASRRFTQNRIRNIDVQSAATKGKGVLGTR